MSMISEQIERLRDTADKFVIAGVATDGIVKMFRDAAQTIEELSAKLHEHNGWISCSDRLPKVEDLGETYLEECTSYLVQRRCGLMDVAHYIKVYGEPFFLAHGMELKDVIAWRPLPEPYKEG